MDFLETILKEKAKEIQSLPEITPAREHSPISFVEKVTQEPSRVHVIAEIKRASPSKGLINDQVDIIEQASQYEQAGASAISVLTDAHFFHGSYEDLKKIRAHVQVPLLCKDFIISKKQILLAKAAGADIILLIVAALSDDQLKELDTFARQQGLEVLVEIHNEAEYHRAKKIDPVLLGINNRDLKTFQVDIAVSEHIGSFASAPLLISESGFSKAQDVERIAPRFQAVLVGEALMRSGNPKEMVEQLRVQRP